MKRTVIFILVVAASFNAACQPACIEIKDRQHLPGEIYENLKAYKAILVGEIHGTNESPQFAEGIVNLCLDSGRKVILGLEMEGYEQSRIDSFLSIGDFSIIKRMAFFNDKRFNEGGRGSVAMGNLIKSCYGKTNLKIICIDITNYRKGEDKDSMMAVCVNNTLKGNPGSTLITLTGNDHNKLDSNKYGNPMGYCLYKWSKSTLTRKDIASFDVVYDTGTAWCCQPDCGIHHEAGYPSWLTDKCNYDNFFRVYKNGDMFLFTKTISASLPLNP
jgi:hypothetical protein